MNMMCPTIDSFSSDKLSCFDSKTLKGTSVGFLCFFFFLANEIMTHTLGEEISYFQMVSSTHKDSAIFE